MIKGEGIRAVGTVGTSHWVRVGKACGETARAIQAVARGGGPEAGKEADEKLHSD